jgi:hypothetical protein
MHRDVWLARRRLDRCLLPGDRVELLCHIGPYFKAEPYMKTTILADFPGSKFVQALKDGEPVAFAIAAGVFLLIVMALFIKQAVSKKH